MATNKNNEFPVINNEKLHIAFKAFVTSFKENEEDFLAGCYCRGCKISH